MTNILAQFDLLQVLSTLLVMLAIIDTLGSIPTVLSLKAKNDPIAQSNGEKSALSASKAAIYTLLLMVSMYYGGQYMLKFFGVDIASFAAAGSIVILITSLEILLDIPMFKERTPLGSSTLVPVVFPMLAGAGSFTTLLSLRSAFADINIFIGLLINILWIYIIIKYTSKVQSIMGESGIYFTRKFFGIILMAVAVKLFAENLRVLFT